MSETENATALPCCALADDVTSHGCSVSCRRRRRCLSQCWPATLPAPLQTAISTAAVVMLQREIPEAINIAVAQAARSGAEQSGRVGTGPCVGIFLTKLCSHLFPRACTTSVSSSPSAHHVPVFLDMGGEDSAVSPSLLSQLSFLTANETELARIARMPTDTDEQVHAAANYVRSEYTVPHILITLGDRGSLLFLPDGSFVRESALQVERIVDTTGAGDCFRGQTREKHGHVGGLHDSSSHPSVRSASLASKSHRPLSHLSFPQPHSPWLTSSSSPGRPASSLPPPLPASASRRRAR